MLHVSYPKTHAWMSLNSFHTTDLVDRKSSGEQRDLEVCKQRLYSCGVLQYCSSSLTFSPVKIQGGYAVLTQMADLLRYSNSRWFVLNLQSIQLSFAASQSFNVCFCPSSTCCVGLGDFRHIEAFSHEFLPSVVESLLFLADRLMNRALRVRYFSFLNHIELGFKTGVQGLPEATRKCYGVCGNFSRKKV